MGHSQIVQSPRRNVAPHEQFQVRLSTVRSLICDNPRAAKVTNVHAPNRNSTLPTGAKWVKRQRRSPPMQPAFAVPQKVDRDRFAASAMYTVPRVQERKKSKVKTYGDYEDDGLPHTPSCSDDE